MSSADELAARAVRLAAEIKPLLAGAGGPVQGAVLAELLAMWLAGHVNLHDPADNKLREELLAEHLRHVRALVPIMEGEILAHMKRAATMN